MRLYRGDGLGSFYYSLFRDLQSCGEKVLVRGHKCIEFPEPVTLIYTKPGACWIKIPGRKFNPFFALAEVVWILSGRGDIDWIANYNARMRDFNDGGPENHGAYGLRIRKAHTIAGPTDQIVAAVQKLRKDPYTRQAVISLWDPYLDNAFKSKDYPCNNLIYYKLRNSVLDQTVVTRSNDLIWGTPYNAVQFTHLHALVAGELQAEMGTLTYVINNLHYYEDLYPETLACIQEAAAFGGTVAESIGCFETVTDEFFQKVTAQLEYGGSPYWGEVIPRALCLFNTVKARDRAFSIADCAWMLHRLPNVLHWLVRDFWRDSKNEVVQRVLEYEDKHIARQTIGG